MNWLKPIDAAVFVGLPALFTAALVAAAFTHPFYWPPQAIAIAALTLLTSWGISIGVLVSKYRARPDFVLPDGTGVRANGLPITPAMVVNALDFYITHLAMLRPIPELVLRAATSPMRIEFTPGPIHGDKAGLQQGKAVQVHWRSGFDDNAFFHELHHVVEEYVLRRRDYDHSDAYWWSVVPEIQRKWRCQS